MQSLHGAMRRYLATPLVVFIRYAQLLACSGRFALSVCLLALMQGAIDLPAWLRFGAPASSPLRYTPFFEPFFIARAPLPPFDEVSKFAFILLCVRA